jgi:hypothetical protein
MCTIGSALEVFLRGRIGAIEPKSGRKVAMSLVFRSYRFGFSHLFHEGRVLSRPLPTASVDRGRGEILETGRPRAHPFANRRTRRRAQPSLATLRSCGRRRIEALRALRARPRLGSVGGDGGEWLPAWLTASARTYLVKECAPASLVPVHGGPPPGGWRQVVHREPRNFRESGAVIESGGGPPPGCPAHALADRRVVNPARRGFSAWAIVFVVMSYPAEAFGLFDMSANVAEKLSIRATERRVPRPGRAVRRLEHPH